MRLVKREFFYWGRMTLVMTAIGLAVSAGVTVLVFLRERESWGRPEAILSWFGIYSLVIILLMLAAMAVSWFDTYLVIQLSFGCTRREAFAGFQGMKLAGAVLAGLFGSALLWGGNLRRPAQLVSEAWDSAGGGMRKFSRHSRRFYGDD